MGCGAVSEFLHAPALRVLCDEGRAEVAALVDPSRARLAILGGLFPKAQQVTGLEELSNCKLDMAIIASPQNLHYEHTVALLERGVHSFCEKPMAATVADGARMIRVAEAAGKLLGVGLFRRFFPSSRMVKSLVDGGALGKPVSFAWSEGGRFDWPAASPSFFQKEKSAGGVLADLGVHILDLLLYWFGDVDEVDYSDDAVGGLESNARVKLRFASGVHGSLRLSRDTAIPVLGTVKFEKGTLLIKGATADQVTLLLDGCEFAAQATLWQNSTGRDADVNLLPARTYAQSFVEQLRNFCSAVSGEARLEVPGTEAIKSLQLLARCYEHRRLMTMPWLSPREQVGAEAFHAQSVFPDLVSGS